MSATVWIGQRDPAGNCGVWIRDKAGGKVERLTSSPSAEDLDTDWFDWGMRTAGTAALARALAVQYVGANYITWATGWITENVLLQLPRDQWELSASDLGLRLWRALSVYMASDPRICNGCGENDKGGA